MKPGDLRALSWVALLLVPALVVTGCIGVAVVPTPAPTAQPTPAAPSSPEPAASPTAAPDTASTPMDHPLETPAPVQAIKAESTPASTVLYEADFTNRSSGWPDERVFDNYYIGYHEPDFYHVEVHVAGDHAIAALPGHTFDDFAAETQVLTSKANTAPNGDFRYGLAIRRSGSRYYAFTISPRTKTWYVLKSTPTGLQVLSQGQQDSIQGLQALDTLHVNAQGPILTFSINGQQVSQVNDSDYASGETGFYVETLDSPKAHIHYRSLIIRKPENLPFQPAPAPMCEVVSERLNLRRGPGLTDPPIVLLYRGTQLEPLGRSPNESWVQVRMHEGDHVGWVSAPGVSCSMPIASLPTSEPTPLPSGSVQ